MTDKGEIRAQNERTTDFGDWRKKNAWNVALKSSAVLVATQSTDVEMPPVGESYL